MAGSDTRYAEIYLIRIQHLMFYSPSIYLHNIFYTLAVKTIFVIFFDFRETTWWLDG